MHALDGKTIVFIGGGNMARAMIDGLLNAQQQHQLTLTLGVSDKHADKRAYFAAKGMLTSSPDTADQLIAQADMVVLAIKPQALGEVAPTLMPYLHDKLVLSVLAGVPIATLSQCLGTERIVRAMPNLPASIGAGASGLYGAVSPADQALAEAVMASSGISVWVAQETHLHAVTAVAGSAPAYFFYLLEHMIDAAVKLGLDADTAKRLATQSLIGAGQLAQHGDPATLRAQVTSKGGTTAAAIEQLQAHDVGTSWQRAMHACHHRSMELSQIFDAVPVSSDTPNT